MTFKKGISTLLIASQVAMTSMAFAASAPAASASPEFSMLQSVFALQGQKLSDQARQAQIGKILGTYTNAAPADGRTARLQDALVQLGVYTPAQAQQFMKDAQASEAAVRATQQFSADQTHAALAQQIVHLAQLHPAGAQFSKCEIAVTVGLVGALTAFVGIALIYDNPSCYNDVLGSATGCTYSYNTNPVCFDSTIYGPTVCTRPDYYPNRKTGNGLLIGGGIAAAVGALVYFAGGDCY